MGVWNLWENRGRWRTCARALAFSFALALALAMLMGLHPGQAHARFNDVTDSFPAAQDLGSYGSPITGSDLPDGAYQVKARTDSRMCIMYTNPANAEARDSKEQAIVSVNGGKLTVVFYISPRYTYLYFGTMEQAAAATNKKGTDASSYIAGDPAEGYVPHLFTLPIEALNKPVTVATYAGGYDDGSGLEQGKWYTRRFVFVMTDAELQKIKSAAAAEEEAARKAAEEEAAKQAAEEEARKAEEEAAKKAAEEEAAKKAAEEEAAKKGGEEAGSQDGDQGKGAGANENGNGKDPDNSKESGGEPDEPDKGSSSSKSSAGIAGGVRDEGGNDGGDEKGGAGGAAGGGSQQAVLSEDNVVTQGGQGGQGGQDGQGEGDDSSDSSDGEGAQSASQAGGAGGQMRGVRMTFANKDVVIDLGDGDDEEAGDAGDAGWPLLTKEQAVAFGMIALLGLGALLRGVLYLRAFEGTASPPMEGRM